MVLKGAAARKLKKLRIEGRPERSLYVKFQNRGEREKILEILEPSHPGIERVYLPRQKYPKFVTVLCKGENEREGVKNALRSLKDTELGDISVKHMKPKPKKSNTTAVKQEIDRTKLLLEMIPAELETKVLEEAFPEAVKINRFNKRRCYIHFKGAKAAMKARVRLSNGEIAGHKLIVKFSKIDKSVGSDDDGDVVEVKDENETDTSSNDEVESEDEISDNSPDSE